MNEAGYPTREELEQQDARPVVGFLSVTDDDRVRVFTDATLTDHVEVAPADVAYVEPFADAPDELPLVTAWVTADVEAAVPGSLDELGAQLLSGEVADAAAEAETPDELFAWGDVEPQTTVPCTLRVCVPVVTKLACTQNWVHSPLPTPLCTVGIC